MVSTDGDSEGYIVCVIDYDISNKADNSSNDKYYGDADKNVSL